MFEAVLFDLDGTLADTAPDLGGALNRLRAEEGLTPVALELLRPYTSQGVRGLIQAGMALTPQDAQYQRLADRFLAIYAANLCVATRLFDGMPELLDDLESAGLCWGIVTNKRTAFTLPLLEALGLLGRAATVVSGDTIAQAKPSPLPLLHACQEAGCQPGKTLYVGDHLRDVQAGKAACMGTAVVSFGYLGDGEPVETWGADFLAHDVPTLARYIFGEDLQK